MRPAAKQFPNEVTPELLRQFVGRRVEVIAFGIAYRGRLEKVDANSGTIRIVDRGNSAVLEIERIESFEKIA